MEKGDDIDILVLYRETFKNLMKLIKAFMKTQGFSSRGNNFYKRHPDGNIGTISFKQHPGGVGRFYIYVGVYSIALAEFFLGKYVFEKPEVKTHPSAFDGHWYIRIEDLIPKKSSDYAKVSVDHRWNLFDHGCWNYCYDSDFAALAAEINYIIAAYVIPEIDERITDRQIFDRRFASNWQKYFRANGLSELSALALILGEHEKVKIVLAEFQKHLPTFAKDYARIAKAVGFDTERQIFDKCFAADWKESYHFDLLYLADLALSLGELEKLRAVLTEIKKQLPKPSLKIAQIPTFKKLREGYQRIVQEAGLESEGF